MTKLVSSLLFASTMFAISAAPALAWGQWLGQWSVRPTQPRAPASSPVHSVPEIDASAGLLAIAAVVVVLAFVWERNRRAAA